MIRVTPDTNVPISAVLLKGSERKVLRYAIEGEVRFVLSSELLDEMKSIIGLHFRSVLEDVSKGCLGDRWFSTIGG